MLQKKYTKPAGKALAVGLMTAWLSTGAMASGPETDVSNDVELQKVSSHSSLQTDASYSHLYDKAKIAKTASQHEIETVGIYVNRGHDVSESESEIVGLVEWLLDQNNINQSVITSGQGDGETTTFTVFVAGQPKMYSFSNIERGIATAATDLDEAIKAKRFEVSAGLSLTQN